MTEPMRSLASALKPADTTPVSIVKAVVTAVNLTATPPSLDCQIGGDTSTTVAGVRFLDAYSPVVGDTCLIIKQGSDVFALGHVDDTNEGTSANGWQTPTLNTNYTTNGNTNGPLFYRIVLDNGDRKVQFKGSVALSGSPGSAIFTLPAAYRPTNKTSLLCTRDPAGGSNVEQIDVQTDGQVIRVGSTIGIKTVTIGVSGGSTAHATGEPISGHGTAADGEPGTDFFDTASGTNHQHGFGHHHDVNTHTHTAGTVTPTTVSAPTWIGFNGLEFFI